MGDGIFSVEADMPSNWGPCISWSQVDKAALMKRHEQGWLMEVTSSLDHCIERLRYSA